MAAVYDRVMARPERACLAAWRREILENATGRVLEVGAGTGVNLAWYSDAVEQLVLSEPDPHMRSRLAKKLGDGHVEVTASSLGGLDFADGSFDTVVSTLVLCSVANPASALADIHRVLAPGGQLLFIEHVAADSPGRLRWQRRIEPLWKHLAGNCHITRDTEAAIRAAGLVIERIERDSMRKAFPWVRPTIRGSARKP
jgi:ubiquinone/menaquinone biosynthesis C-methylase UbiE